MGRETVKKYPIESLAIWDCENLNLVKRSLTIPLEWFDHLESTTAMFILADIIFWHTPWEELEDGDDDVVIHTGKWFQRFKGPALRKFRHEWAKKFRVSKITVSRAIQELVDAKVVDIEYKTVQVGDMVRTNVMYVTPIIETIKRWRAEGPEQNDKRVLTPNTNESDVEGGVIKMIRGSEQNDKRVLTKCSPTDTIQQKDTIEDNITPPPDGDGKSPWPSLIYKAYPKHGDSRAKPTIESAMKRYAVQERITIDEAGEQLLRITKMYASRPSKLGLAVDLKYIKNASTWFGKKTAGYNATMAEWDNEFLGKFEKDGSLQVKADLASIPKDDQFLVDSVAKEVIHIFGQDEDALPSRVSEATSVVAALNKICHYIDSEVDRRTTQIENGAGAKDASALLARSRLQLNALCEEYVDFIADTVESKSKVKGSEEAGLRLCWKHVGLNGWVFRSFLGTLERGTDHVIQIPLDWETIVALTGVRHEH